LITRRRWLQIGAALSVLGVVFGVVLSALFAHRYGGNTIVIREWLVVLSCAIAVPSMLGAGCIAKAADGWPARLLFAGAAATWLAHAVLIGALIDQPIATGSGWVTLLTAAVCLPSILRALALCTWRSARLFGVVDLAIAIVFWAQTPVEVIARAHVAQMAWWAVIPCVLALIIVGVKRDA
jgi:hypothetical protein